MQGKKPRKSWGQIFPFKLYDASVLSFNHNFTYCQWLELTYGETYLDQMSLHVSHFCVACELTNGRAYFNQMSLHAFCFGVVCELTSGKAYLDQTSLHVSSFCVVFELTSGRAYLNQTSLHVSGFCCFDSSVHQALSTSHCVEEKLRRGQSTIETVLHKSTSSWVLC